MGAEEGLVARGTTLGSTTPKVSAAGVADHLDVGSGAPKSQVVTNRSNSRNKYSLMANQEIQVGLGKRRNQVDTSVRVVIFALNIPSWLLVVKSLGFETVSMYCEDKSCWFCHELALEVQEDFKLPSLELPNWNEDDQRNIFIQGDSEFCARIGTLISPLLKSSDRVLWVSSCSTRKDNTILNKAFPSKYKFWESQVVRHCEVGGISLDKCRIGWSTQGDIYGPLNGFKLIKDSVMRSLQSKVSTMEPGIPCASPVNDPNIQGCLCLDTHMYASCLTGTFRTPFQLS